MNCILTDCPAWQRGCGCGWLSAGSPCGHPRRREDWARAMASLAYVLVALLLLGVRNVR